MAKHIDPPPKQEFTISGAAIKWVISIAVGIVALIGGWFVIWDRVDTHWRLEQVQAAKDKEQEMRDKQVHAEIAAVSKKAEIGRSWVLWSVQDTKAYTAAQFARMCRALKLPTDECARQDGDAQLFRQDATNAKRDATEAGKDK